MGSFLIAHMKVRYSPNHYLLLPLSCEISGALHLAQPGLTAGWLAGRQTKYRLILKFSKLAVG